MLNTTDWVRLSRVPLPHVAVTELVSSFRKFDVNIWSSFEIRGNPDMTLEGFIREVEVSSFARRIDIDSIDHSEKI